MDDRLQDSARTWPAVVRTLGANAVLCLVHSQQATVGGTQFEDEKMLALYDVKKVYMETTVSWGAPMAAQLPSSSHSGRH